MIAIPICKGETLGGRADSGAKLGMMMRAYLRNVVAILNDAKLDSSQTRGGEILQKCRI